MPSMEGGAPRPPVPPPYYPPLPPRPGTMEGGVPQMPGIPNPGLPPAPGTMEAGPGDMPWSIGPDPSQFVPHPGGRGANMGGGGFDRGLAGRKQISRKGAPGGVDGNPRDMIAKAAQRRLQGS